MKSGIKPLPLEKSQKINKHRGMFIPDSFYVKTIGTQARAFLPLNILAIGRVF